MWSPRLDDIGNSVRGVATAKELLKYIAIHNFEVFSGLCHDKIDPTKRKHELKQKELGNVLFAAKIAAAEAFAAFAAADFQMASLGLTFGRELQLKIKHVMSKL